MGPSGVKTVDFINLQEWDFLFFVSFSIGLYAVHRLSMVSELGEVEEKVVVVELFSALGRELRDFSTVAAVRNLSSIVPHRPAMLDEEESDEEGDKKEDSG